MIFHMRWPSCWLCGKNRFRPLGSTLTPKPARAVSRMFLVLFFLRMSRTRASVSRGRFLVLYPVAVPDETARVLSETLTSRGKNKQCSNNLEPKVRCGMRCWTPGAGRSRTRSVVSVSPVPVPHVRLVDPRRDHQCGERQGKDVANRGRSGPGHRKSRSCLIGC